MLIIDGPALEHDLEKTCSGLDPGWMPVSRLREALISQPFLFRRFGGRGRSEKDHAQTQAEAKWRFILISFRFRRRMIAKPMARASACDDALLACGIS
jgi:hypothetical protein